MPIVVEALHDARIVLVAGARTVSVESGTGPGA
jgi:hypothetical protein